MEKVNHFNCKRKKEFSMGPSVKFVLAIIDSISKKKMGVNFFSRKIGHEGGGGGSEGFVSVDAKITDLNF